MIVFGVLGFVIPHVGYEAEAATPFKGLLRPSWGMTDAP